jgi:hypothetical protein
VSQLHVEERLKAVRPYSVDLLRQVKGASLFDVYDIQLLHHIFTLFVQNPQGYFYNELHLSDQELLLRTPQLVLNRSEPTLLSRKRYDKAAIHSTRVRPLATTNRANRQF